MKRLRFAFFAMALLYATLMSGCTAGGGEVRLCDYKNIPLPSDILEITEDDIASAVSVDMFAFRVLIPKALNADMVEDGDVVKASVSVGDEKAQECEFIAGTSFGGDDFAKAVLNKRVGETFTFVTEDGEAGRAEVISVSAYAERISDEIVEQYYQCETAEEAIQLIKMTIAEARIFDTVFPEIVNNSMIRGYEAECAAYVERALTALTHDAEQEGYQANEIETFLANEMDTTLTEYRHSMESFYDVYLIMCELMEEEKIFFSEDVFDEYCRKEFGEDFDKSLTDEELFGAMGREYAIYSMYYFDLCPKALAKYYLDLFQM